MQDSLCSEAGSSYCSRTFTCKTSLAYLGALANESLAVSSHSGNLVSTIAYLIKAALQERCESSPESHADYQRELVTVTGLGFTAVLAEGSQVRSCRPYFATFLRYRDFLQHTDKLEPLSHAIAGIICSALEPFGQLGHPRYYDDFIGALINALQSSNDHEAKKKGGIKRIMQLLFEQYAQCSASSPLGFLHCLTGLDAF